MAEKTKVVKKELKKLKKEKVERLKHDKMPRSFHVGLQRYKELIQKVKPHYDIQNGIKKFVKHVPFNDVKCEHEFKNFMKKDEKNSVTYARVCTKCGVDEKAGDDDPKVVALLCTEADMLRNTMRGVLGTKPLEIRIAYQWAESKSSTATAQAPVHRIRPSDSNEFSALAGLFDEYKCIRTKKYITMNVTSPGTGGIHAGCAYDPQNSTAYAGLADILIGSQNIGLLNVLSSGAFGSAPASARPKGVWEMDVHMPEGSQYEYGVTTTIATGNWTETGITAVDYGYYKFYVESAGTGGTTFVYAHDVQTCLFRCRT